MARQLKVGVVQDFPVFFDKTATLHKISEIVSEAKSNSCELVIFPESFIPGYPRGLTFGTAVGHRTQAGRDLYARYYENSLDLDSQDLDYLIDLSKSKGIYLVIGITERQNNNGTLYCSMLYLSPTDGLLGVHRKLKPTAAERIVWGEGKADSLVSFDTKIGKLGGLICWENFMPLARMAMYRKGVEIYIAPTADARENWISSLRHIAMEGRCFVIGCNQYMTPSNLPDDIQELIEPNEMQEFCAGGSVIVSPLGEIIAGPVYGRTALLSATIDLEDVVRARFDFDVVGHYARDDIFTFDIPDQPEIIKEKG